MKTAAWQTCARRQRALPSLTVTCCSRWHACVVARAHLRLNESTLHRDNEGESEPSNICVWNQTGAPAAAAAAAAAQQHILPAAAPRLPP